MQSKMMFVILAVVAMVCAQVNAGVLTGVTIDSSYGFHATYSAAKLVDGVTAANFAHVNDNTAGWVIFDLGDGGQTFSKARMSAASYGGTVSQTFSPNAGTLEYSNDKSTWSAVRNWSAARLESAQGYLPDFSEDSFGESVTARYVRWNVNRLVPGGWLDNRIGEFQFVNNNTALAVWENAQNSSYVNTYPATNAVDDNAATFAVNSNGIVYDQGFSGNVSGFKMQARATWPASPEGGSLWVSDSPDSGFVKVDDWTLPTLAGGEWGTVDFGASALSGRYVKLDDMTGPGKQWAEFEIVPEPATMMLLVAGGLGLLRRRK